MSVLAVIPARGGSKRIPRKNMQVVGGMTLVERAFKCALQAQCFDRVVVSTDDDEIAAHIDAMVPGFVAFRHEADRGDVPIGGIVRRFANTAKHVVLVEPTCPQRTPAHLVAVADYVRDSERTQRLATVFNDGHSWRRNGVAFAFQGDADHFDSKLPWAALPLGGDVIDINTPEDLERVRAIMG